MVKSKVSRYFLLFAFLLVATFLVLCAIFFPGDIHLVATAFLLVSFITLLSTFLDRHIEKRLRIIFYVLGGILLVASIVGFVLTETQISTDAYCLVYAILEITSGVVKIYEGITIVKEKNKMGYLFILDGIIEAGLGIMVAIEKEEGLKMHLYYIAADKVYEGIIKFINSIIEEKKGIIKE